VTRPEPEWRLEDVALMQAGLERETEPTSHGVPVSVAYDSDLDPYNMTSPTMLEPYFYTDYAEKTVELAKAREVAAHDDRVNEHRVWGVKQVPRPPRPTGGG
jgi:hypothetical protein